MNENAHRLEEVAITLGKYAAGINPGGPPTKAVKQLDYLRVAIEALCEVGNLEPRDRVSAVASRVLRAMTPLRNLEALLVRTIELEHLERHIESSDPTPGLAVKAP
jgi:hypothetical protein